MALPGARTNPNAHGTDFAAVAGVGEEDKRLLRFWMAMFRQGLQDVGYESKHAIRGDATAWFWSKTNEPGSFDWLCDLFSLDPGWAREKVRTNIDSLARGVGQRFGS